MMVTFARQLDRVNRVAMRQGCLRSGPRTASPALLSQNSRLGNFFLDAGPRRLTCGVSRATRPGSDGASLGFVSGLSIDPIAADINLYRYCGNNPTNNTDPLGLAPNQAGTTDPSHVVDRVRELESQGLSKSEILSRIRDEHAGNDNRYFYTDENGWVDIRHFGEAANYANSYGSVITESLGFANEVVQWLTEWGDDYRSGFSPEDIPSNSAGAEFGDDYVNDNESLADSLERWLKDKGARNQNDPKAGRDKLPATDPSEHGGKGRGSSNPSSNPRCGCATGGSN